MEEFLQMLSELKDRMIKSEVQSMQSLAKEIAVLAYLKEEHGGPCAAVQYGMQR